MAAAINSQLLGHGYMSLKVPPVFLANLFTLRKVGQRLRDQSTGEASGMPPAPS